MSGGGVSGYAALHARVRAMTSTLIAPEMWAYLREAPDFRTLLSHLKETPYGPDLDSVDEHLLTPRRAAYQIRHRLAQAYLKVIRLAPKSVSALLTDYYRRFELNNLKAVLRGIIADASWERVNYVLFPFGAMTTLPAQQMVETGNLAAAIEQLRGTVYYDTLTHAMKRYTVEQNLFPLEVAIDLNYWRTVWAQIGRLSGHDHDQALRLIGTHWDMNNLMWATRYRIYYHLSEEEIINYTLPSGYRVYDADIRAIAAGADIARIVSRVYPSLTNVDTLLQDPHRGLPALEMQLRRHLVQQCHAAFAGYPFHVGIPLAYLMLLEYEINDLVVLIEAKSGQMPANRFMPYLLMQGSPN